MKPPNDDHTTQPDPMNLPEQRTTDGRCGTGCGCKPGSPAGKACWVFGALVLIVAAILIYQFIIKPGESESTASQATFAIPTSAATTPMDPPVVTVSDADGKQSTTTVGTVIGKFEELNTAAAASNAVFIYLPANDGQTHEAPETAMKEAAKAIESRIGMNIPLFTLQPGSPDYDMLAGQMSLPGVLALVKGGGMIPVSGEITTSDLVQGFFTAASAGGCSSGCR